jgi:hypothetical protein
MVMPTIDVTPPIICMMEVIDARRLAWTSGRCCQLSKPRLLAERFD